MVLFSQAARRERQLPSSSGLRELRDFAVQTNEPFRDLGVKNPPRQVVTNDEPRHHLGQPAAEPPRSRNAFMSSASRKPCAPRCPLSQGAPRRSAAAAGLTERARERRRRATDYVVAFASRADLGSPVLSGSLSRSVQLLERGCLADVVVSGCRNRLFALEGAGAGPLAAPHSSLLGRRRETRRAGRWHSRLPPLDSRHQEL